jgi:hypothetical protein
MGMVRDSIIRVRRDWNAIYGEQLDTLKKTLLRLPRRCKLRMAEPGFARFATGTNTR